MIFGTDDSAQLVSSLIILNEFHLKQHGKQENYVIGGQLQERRAN